MIKQMFDGNKDLVLVFGTILILVILFSPIPPAMLDLAIIVNFGLALTIMLLTFYVKKPVEFSTFPSLLLVATLYRLSLNVAATRLILTDAHAGDVIDSIGAYAVQGNFVIGLVVFAILVVVQYVVVTSGAQRVSEVAARFTLDSMPGQQMSIDADLNLGLIDGKEAIARREALEREASFYGAMDGASKFVKGDAIAGIIILLINIIAGLIIGVMQMGMTWGDALQRFSLLTVGDGIATQLPALIVSIATGIIVTRSSADRELSAEVFGQLASVPKIPLIVLCVLSALMLLPGMPKWPIIIMAAFAFFAWMRIRRSHQSKNAAEQLAEENEAIDARASSPLAPIEVRLGAELLEEWQNRKALLLERVAAIRTSHEKIFGISFPMVRFVDGTDLGSLDYQVNLYGVTYGTGQVHPQRLLALRQDDKGVRLDGIEGRDPAFGIPGVWIQPSQEFEATNNGHSVIDPETVLMTHFSEIVKSEVATLLTRATTVELIDGLRERQPGLVEELVPNIMTISDVQRVLQNLLQERVSIANIDFIVEILVDVGRTERDHVELTEHIRQRMSTAICNSLRGHHSQLAVLSLDPRVENQIVSSLSGSASQNVIGVDPRLAEQLLRKIAPMAEKMIRQGRAPVLLCAGQIRRSLLKLTQRSIPQLSILSVEEIPLRTALQSFEVVKLDS